MADSRINLLSSASSTASDDFFVVDGNTNGTRKLNAFSPTIGGNLAVTGTLTVSSTSSFAGNATLQGSALWLNDGGGGTFNFVNGSTVANTLRLGIGNTNQVLITDTKTTILATTASTSTSSGALVVGNGTSGGLGVGGDANIGGSLTVTGASNGIICNGAGLSLNTAGSASVRFQDAGVSKWWIYKLSGDPWLYFRDMVNGRMQLQMVPGATSSTAISTFNSNLEVTSTSASTTTSSGALVVGNGTSGGLGVGGAINAGGLILSSGSTAGLGAESRDGSGYRATWYNPTGDDMQLDFAGIGTKFTITSAGNTTIAGTLTVNGSSPSVFRSLFTATRQVEIQIPHTVSTENYLRVASNNGTTYGGDFGYGLTAGGDPEIRFNAVHAGAVTNWLTVRTTTALPSFPKAVSITDATASTSTSTGALVVSGGMGIAKQIVAGGVISIDPLDASPEDLAPEVAFCRGVSLATTASVLAFGSGARIGLLRGYQDGGNLVEWRFGSYIGTTFNEQMRLGGTSATSSSLTLYGTTASTSTSSGALVVSGGVGVAGALYAANLGGTSTNNNAASGCIGEYTSATTAYASKVSLTSNTAANIVSISLTAGDWDVQFNPVFTQDTPLTTSGLLAGVSSSSATLPSGAAERAHSPSGPNGNSDISIAPPVTRISLASTTTIYGVATGIFSAGTMSAYGFIRARRVR